MKQNYLASNLITLFHESYSHLLNRFSSLPDKFLREIMQQDYKSS